MSKPRSNRCAARARPEGSAPVGQPRAALAPCHSSLANQTWVACAVALARAKESQDQRTEGQSVSNHLTTDIWQASNYG